MTLEIIGHQSNCLLFSQYDLTLGIFFCNITKEEATKRAFSPCISNRNHPSHAPLLSIPQTFPCISILFLDKWNKGHPWSKIDGIIERVRVFLTFECPWEGEGGGGPVTCWRGGSKWRRVETNILLIDKLDTWNINHCLLWFRLSSPSGVYSNLMGHCYFQPQHCPQREVPLPSSYWKKSLMRLWVTSLSTSSPYDLSTFESSLLDSTSSSFSSQQESFALSTPICVYAKSSHMTLHGIDRLFSTRTVGIHNVDSNCMMTPRGNETLEFFIVIAQIHVMSCSHS